jgi:hypothetical protein
MKVLPLFVFLSLPALNALAGVDYSRDIQPILAEHCTHCHGADVASRKGGLRLDVREDALKGVLA